MRNKNQILFIILLIMFLVLSCSPFGLVKTTQNNVQDPVESNPLPSLPAPLHELLSYIPIEWIDQHPPELLGPIVYYLDFDAMSSDLGLPNVTGADSREAKLPLITGIRTQNISYAPFDPLSGSSYTLWGWDIADIAQSLYISSVEIYLMAGSFSKDTITSALTEQGYASMPSEKFTLLVDPEETQWFAVSEGILLCAPSRDILETAILQKSSDNANAGHVTHLRQLLDLSESPHGFIIIPSGDIKALSERLISEHLGACIYTSDWDYMMVAFHTIDETAQLDIGYSFLTSQDAMENVTLVQDTLTLTPSLMNRNETWADLLTLNKIEADDNLVVVQASAIRKNVIGSAIINRDYWGLIPLRKVDLKCRDIGE